MIIYSMTATFGKLEHETLTLQPGLNILEAPNEWGKSTWCAFLTAMLYGIETRVHTTKTSLADKERYAPWSGSPMAGRIDLNWNGKDITIERWSKGRSVFGQFRAYETDTGIEISELTAAGCGQMLLGVEKSVFLRAGFLRLTDLPVTEDEALRRRLNALVTTGDESGTADALAQKLRDLKNRCRVNRSNGLLPQAEAQRGELESKLRQLKDLQAQTERLREREVQLEAHHARLVNHSNALVYETSKTYSGKLLAAKNAQMTAQARCRAMEEACAADPDPAELEQRLAQLQQLRQYRESVSFDAQMLQPPAQAPQVPEAFRGLSEEDARRYAQTDVRVYEESAADCRKSFLLILGAILAAAGIAGLVFGNAFFKVLGALAVIGGILCINSQLAARRRGKATMDALARKYDRTAPETWIETATGWARVQAQWNAQQHAYRQRQEELQQRRRELDEQAFALTKGEDLLTCERRWQEARERQKELLDARRELQRVGELVQALQTSHREAAPPAEPDTMTFTQEETNRLLADCTLEQRQLHSQLGHLRGHMEALGREDNLQRQLSEVQERIVRLEDTVAALEIAQETLSQAASELQRRFAPRISRRAQELFSKLTNGRYDRLTLDSDLAVHAGAAEETTLRSALWRSEGTTDQLYLALRLAVAEELTPNTPLVLDDALVRFDDQRLSQAMEILAEVAQTRQVILFTCQSREKAWQQEQ